MSIRGWMRWLRRSPEPDAAVPPANTPNSRRLQVAGPPGMSAVVNCMVISSWLVTVPGPLPDRLCVRPEQPVAVAPYGSVVHRGSSRRAGSRWRGHHPDVPAAVPGIDRHGGRVHAEVGRVVGVDGDPQRDAVRDR